MTRLFVVAAAACVSLVLAAAAGADVKESWTSTGNVSSYVAISYNTQFCDGNWKYQLWMIEYRWYRQYTDRGVRARTNYGEFGTDCRRIHHNPSQGLVEFTVCFTACTGHPNWSEHYISMPYAWPYVGYPAVHGWSITPYTGAYARSEVFNRYTRTTLGVMCNRAMALGSIGC